METETAASGTTVGLSAGQVTEIGEDADTVTTVVDFTAAVEAYRQEVTAWAQAVLEGDPLAPMPTAPIAPATPTFGIAAKPGVEARTRSLMGIVKASTNYTVAIGEAYQIVAPGGGLATPALKAASVPGTSDVSLRIAKGGYSVIAIDMRRGGGDWTQIGVSQLATFVDSTAALVAGQPETREYRAQGMVANARTGDLSPTVSVVTTP
ncbi:MAG: hypothetical protein WD716_13115 [Fimbriimonadaceae bacterium]